MLLPPEVIYGSLALFLLTCSNSDPPLRTLTCDLVFLLKPSAHHVLPAAQDALPAACVMFATTKFMFEGQKVKGGVGRGEAAGLQSQDRFYRKTNLTWF